MDSQLNSNGKIWLLVEVETAAGRNSYMIVDSDEVIGHPNKDKMHTGKSIYIPKGKKQAIQATIVIISDDKHFLDTELQQLIKMSAENLAQNLKFENVKLESVKHPPSKRRKIRTDSLSKSVVNSSWISGNSSNSSDVTTNLINTIPPMTFDQQTQTDNNVSNNDLNHEQFSKLLVNVTKILNEQRANKSESNEMKDIILNLAFKVDGMQKNMNSIKSKLLKSNNKMDQKEHPDILVNSTLNDSNKIIFLNDVKTNDSGNWKNMSEIIDSSETIYEFENVDENQLSETKSDFSEFYLNDSVQSVGKRKGKIIKNNRSSSSNMSLNSSVSNTNKDVTKWLQKKSNKESEFVAIGLNQTMVPQQVIESINWNQHTAATRKLLTNVFSRDVLATHSLTGKPSPAFMDQKKPIKQQLDHKKVADIIHIVTKFCGVAENFVRNVITTKCADENKMKRQRQEKMLKETSSNKENVIAKTEIV